MGANFYIKIKRVGHEPGLVRQGGKLCSFDSEFTAKMWGEENLNHSNHIIGWEVIPNCEIHQFINNETTTKKTMTHQLKVWPIYFRRLADGTKKFEVRKNDRDFQAGDNLVLSEWDPETQKFTGTSIEFGIDYVMNGGQFGIQSGFCVLSLSEPF